MGRLNYLTITQPYISFPVSVVSQFLQSLCDSHWDVVIHILVILKEHQAKGCYTKIEVILRLLDIVMQTGQAHPQTDTPLQDIVYLLEAI